LPASRVLRSVRGPAAVSSFLQTMELVVPWSEPEALIEPHYPKAGNGRQPVGLAFMMRIYFLQHWFSLSDPGAEDALYDSPALRSFAGVDLGRARPRSFTTSESARIDSGVIGRPLPRAN